MAEKRPTYTKLYAPDGTHVEVEGEERAQVLKDRGYTDKKPRNPTGPATPAGDQTAELERLKAENEALRQQAADNAGAGK
jgi:hypothetical protein